MSPGAAGLSTGPRTGVSYMCVAGLWNGPWAALRALGLAFGVLLQIKPPRPLHSKAAISLFPTTAGFSVALLSYNPKWEVLGLTAFGSCCGLWAAYPRPQVVFKQACLLCVSVSLFPKHGHRANSPS